MSIKKWMIVKAKKSHLKEILIIEAKLDVASWSKKSIINEIKNDCSYNLVSVHSDKVSGYMFGWMIANEYHLNKIVVSKNFRRKGIAKNMIEMVSNFPNLKRIYLEVSERNKIAKNLYEGFGFTKQGQRSNYYSDGTNAKMYKLEIK